MSDDIEYDNEGNEIPDAPSGPKQLRDRLAKEQAETARLQTELAAASDAQKELAFMKAGIDDSKTATYFRTHYDGDLTVEAIKQAAQEAGILPEATEASTQSVAGQAQMAAAMAGGDTPQYGSVQVGPPTMRITVPAEEAQKWTEFEAALKSGPMGAQRAAEVLQRYGDEVGVGPTDPLSTSPNTTPLQNQQNRIV